MDYKIHITSYGECWDEIAKKYYGDEKLMTILLKENPEYRNYEKLPANIRIKVPTLEEKTLTEEKLPIWKRQ
ncbi:MAG TPA: hypothetical protein EYP82_05045 [Hydrogenothermaceae bacterium]|nr:hypothetical protein [Hydrogenothermaceae bacterium]HIQ49561.1 hypothetical protein [Nanoarchaeota archaeon]